MHTLQKTKQMATVNIMRHIIMEQWEQLTGVLCNKKVPIMLKDKVYKTDNDQANNDIWSRVLGG